MGQAADGQWAPLPPLTDASAIVLRANLRSPLALHVLTEKVRPYVRALHTVCISGGYVCLAAYAWAGLQMGSAPLLQLWPAYLPKECDLAPFSSSAWLDAMMAASGFAGVSIKSLQRDAEK